MFLGKSGAGEITTPGRASVSFEDKITEVQTFWVDKERVWGLRQGSVSLLSAEEWVLVRYALWEMGGKFSIRDLAEAFKGRISQRRIEQLCRQWEARGWLVARPREDYHRSWPI